MLDISFPNEATPTGSTAYYVTRFSKPLFRDNLAALFLWKQQLTKLYSLSDPGIARIKLQWWFEQISQPSDSPSDHPLAMELGRLYRSSSDAANLFKLISDETDRHLHRTPYEDVHEMWQGCLNSGGSFGQLMQLVSNRDIEPSDLNIGGWIFFIEWIQSLGESTRHDIRLLPVKLLKHHALGYDQLLQTEKQKQVKEMLQDLVRQMETRVKLPAQKKSRSPLEKYLRLRQKLFILLAEDDFSVMQQHISLTPVRKLWFAF